MKLAIVSLKGKSSEMIARAASKYFEKVSSFNLKNIRIDVNKETRAMHNDKDLADYDCVYLRGSHKFVDLLASIALALKNKVYMPIKPEAFLIAHNKLLTEVKLNEGRINFPTTHLVYETETAKVLVNNFHYPIVFKTLTGTHGKGVMFADSLESANSIIDMLSKLKEPYIIQEFIETGATDIRALIIGREVIAMKRVAKKGELRAGIHSGGEGIKYELDYDEIQLARKVAKILETDICAVDILKGSTKTFVTEVNLSPGIVGLSEATQINIADKIAQYLYEKTKGFIRERDEKIKSSFDLSGLRGKFDASKEFITNLIIKAGRIILPPALTEASNFSENEEVKIKVKKDKVEIEKLKRVKK